GYTICLWAPVLAECAAILYPDPRQAKDVGELVRTHRATIMLSTATFLRFYIRRCDKDDFRSVRALVCGAEKLPVKLQDEFREKWYNTGDVGPIEPDGFIRITGRVSRFAKIAGEMVPLERLDEELHDALGSGCDRMLAVAAVPDEKRGERLIVLHLPDIEPRL